MSSISDPEYSVAFERPKSIYPHYERKAELQHQTHFCPGCGHGTIHKMVALAIDELGIQDRTIMVGPVGCSVFTYHYFDVGHVMAAHGRAPAVATAVRRSRPEAIVLSYQGDGDLSAIGSAEILHAANRGENITVIFVNNAIYSMTGGQAAPTTLLGMKSSTTPLGRNAATEGYPLRMSELLATLEAPVYIERVALGNTKQILAAGRAIRRAMENQVKGLGFSLIEVLSPCPTLWKKSAEGSQEFVREEMEKTFPLGVFKDKTEEVSAPEPGRNKPTLAAIPSILGVAEADLPEGHAEALDAAASVNLEIRIAGFGGQGVLLLGEMLAEAGLDAGLEVSWLPSYGPEMRSGTSNCHVRLSRKPIDSPLVARPQVLVAMNEPSLRKFDMQVPAGGWILYNGAEFPADLRRDDVHILAAPFTEIAHELGNLRAANMVMLGALLEVAGKLPQISIDAALGRLVKNPKWVELDERAIALGREVAQKAAALV
ncbi:2-oxoacid:acceptor oxidoreductase family protein [Telmatobacter bradus]|uniref:2-oxoacid:acceptor oxidoreductase family protein n=1 Tax=Telmatobacter bradus TaxID=474953 RepID=UPI003B439C6D